MPVPPVLKVSREIGGSTDDPGPLGLRGLAASRGNGEKKARGAKQVPAGRACRSRRTGSRMRLRGRSPPSRACILIPIPNPGRRSRSALDPRIGSRFRSSPKMSAPSRGAVELLRETIEEEPSSPRPFMEPRSRLGGWGARPGFVLSTPRRRGASSGWRDWSQAHRARECLETTAAAKGAWAFMRPPPRRRGVRWLRRVRCTSTTAPATERRRVRGTSSRPSPMSAVSAASIRRAVCSPRRIGT